MGGMQVLEWAASYPGCRVRRPADRLRGLSLGAEHRLPRGRPAGDLRRSGLARRPLLAERRVPARGLAVARMCAHITYLSEQALTRKFGRRLQSAPKDAERGDQPVRRHVRGGELPAPPGQHLRAPVRRQRLSHHHPGDGLFRSGGRPRRRPCQRLPRHAARGSCWSRSPPTGCSRPRRAAPSPAR